jgi:hypothetical protein
MSTRDFMPDPARLTAAAGVRLGTEPGVRLTTKR